MLFSLNLVMALVLCSTAFVTVALGRWVRRRCTHPERLRDIAVVSALLLVPINLVFAYTQGLGPFNGIVLTLSAGAVLTQLACAYLWRVPVERKPKVVTVPTAPAPEVPEPSRLRVLVVGTDHQALEESAGPLIRQFTDAGHEVFALVMSSTAQAGLPAATRTIVVGFPLPLLPDLIKPMTGAVVEQVESLAPEVIIGPGADVEGSAVTTLHRATRYALEGQLALFYADGARGDAVAPGDDVQDWVFQRPAEEAVDDARVTMPIFGSPWG